MRASAIKEFLIKASPIAWLMTALMFAAAIAGVALQPKPPPDIPPFLEETVPEAFGEWTKMDEPPHVADPGTIETMKKIYKEVLSRSYVNAAGYRIMLTVARSGNQVGIQEAHRPEVCYPAQGFEVLGKVDPGSLATPYGSIDVERLTAKQGARIEPITYWLTMADRVVRTQWDKRVVQFIAALTGQTPGGLLFRVSSIDEDSARAFAIQQKFVDDMMQSVSGDARHKLAGLVIPQP